MHATSYEKMRQFVRHYLSDRELSVLDVGAASSQAGTPPYRDLFADPRFRYVGLDLAAGVNVDFVPTDPQRWDLADETFDAVVCGQTFEHDPFFWLTTAQIALVLKPGGHLCVVAPSSGIVHRFPWDCWRFYPDAGAALCAYVGLELVECYVERPTPTRDYRTLCALEHGHDSQCNVSGLEWADMLLIARKPTLTGQNRDAFYDRLTAILATSVEFPDAIGPVIGPAIAAYEALFPETGDESADGVFGWSYFDR